MDEQLREEDCKYCTYVNIVHSCSKKKKKKEEEKMEKIPYGFLKDGTVRILYDSDVIVRFLKDSHRMDFLEVLGSVWKSIKFDMYHTDFKMRMQCTVSK